MATQTKAHDVVVLARSGHGQNWVELFHVNKQREADHFKDPANKDKAVPDITIDEAKKAAIDYIREHRNGSGLMDYRVRDYKTGAILD